MYTFIVVFQAICVIIAVITLLSLVFANPMQQGKFLFIAMSGTIIQSLGYFLEITAKDMGSALTAVKMEYVGLCFGFLSLVVYVFKVCHIKPPKLLFPILLAINLATVGLVVVCEYHPFYYTWIGFSTDWLYPHLVFGRGPQYWIHMATMTFMVFITVGAGIRRYSVSEKSERKQYVFLHMLVSFGFITIILLAGYLTGLFGYYDPTPLILLMICIFVRFNIMDITQTAMSVVVNTIHELIIVVDGECRYLDCNSEALKVFPALEKSAAGRRMKELSPLIEGLIVNRSKKEFKIGDRYYQSHIADIYGKNKAVNGHVACIIDVTESYLNVKQIISMKNKADEANRSKSEFLANVSHEIRTPMNAILGMAELALKEDMNDNVKDCILDIKTAGNTLLALINDILDFSKIESNKVDIINESYQFSSLISDAVSITTARLNTKEIELRQLIDPTIPKALVGDMFRIKQVLLNLLANAVKFTEKGYIELSAKWRKEEDGNAFIEIIVKDTGIGISEKNIKKLFTSFQRVDSRKNRSIEGAGLGLAISKKLIDKMGGTVSVSSVYGEGSTFSFSLHQKICDETPCEYNPAVHNRVEATAFENGFVAPKATILVVDDNPVNLKIACGFLKSYLMTVDTASSGKECLEMVEKKRYDIIFLDYMMPVLDGIDTLQIIRSKKIDNDYFGKVPVVALTADAVSGASERFKRFGFQGYISKPIPPIKLEEEMLKFLPSEYIEEKPDIMPHKQKVEKYDIRIDGVETSIGIENCGGEISDYIQVLTIFERYGKSKLDKLSKNIFDNDINAYTIEVHSLKSSSANIGALEVSQLAKKLEVAGKNSDIDFIKENNDELIKIYSRLIDNISATLNSKGEYYGENSDN